MLQIPSLQWLCAALKAEQIRDKSDWASMTGADALQIVTYKIHTVLKDTSMAGEVDEDDDEAFIRSLKIRTLCELPKHGARRPSGYSSR